MSLEPKSEIIKRYLLQELLPGEDPATLTDQTPLRSSGILDSIATLNLVSFLEKTFGIEIYSHEVDIDNFENVSLIVKLIESKL